jgi:hypothetical protein
MNYFSETLKKKMKQQYSYKASRQTGRQPQCQHFTLINSTVSRKKQKREAEKARRKIWFGGTFFSLLDHKNKIN